MRLIKSMTAMLLCLLLLCACGKQEGPLPLEEQTVNQLLVGTKNYLKIRVWDGQQTTLYWVEREENAIPAIDALKAVPVRPADDWSFDFDLPEGVLDVEVYSNDEDVATVAINGAKNAAVLAAQILAVSDDELAAKLDAAREDMARQIAEKEAKLQADLAN